MSEPLVLAMLKLDNNWVVSDETPWCSAFASFICKFCGVIRSKSLAARSWLGIGRPIGINDAEIGFDVIILERGAGGHVGFFAGFDGDDVILLGGNQGDSVSYAKFPRIRILGVRRLE